MNFPIELLKTFYEGKGPNDTLVQARAPLDIFFLLEEVERLTKIIIRNGLDPYQEKK